MRLWIKLQLWAMLIEKYYYFTCKYILYNSNHLEKKINKFEITIWKKNTFKIYIERVKPLELYQSINLFEFVLLYGLWSY